MAHTVKKPPAMQETCIQFLGWEDFLEKGMAPHLICLPGEFHGQRSLAGHNPWSCKESDRTGRLTRKSEDPQSVGSRMSPEF